MGKKVQVLLYFALTWRHISFPAGNAVLTVQLCSVYKNSKSPEWEEHAERREQQAACCLLLPVPPATRRQNRLLLYMLRQIHLTATVGSFSRTPLQLLSLPYLKHAQECGRLQCPSGLSQHHT